MKKIEKLNMYVKEIEKSNYLAILNIANKVDNLIDAWNKEHEEKVIKEVFGDDTRDEKDKEMDRRILESHENYGTEEFTLEELKAIRFHLLYSRDYYDRAKGEIGYDFKEDIKDIERLRNKLSKMIQEKE